MLIYDSAMSDALVAERREQGTDKYDEVWNGLYVVSPLANTEHQDLVMAFSHAIAGADDQVLRSVEIKSS